MGLNKGESSHNCLGIIRNTISDGTVVLDISEDLVTGRVGVVGCDTLMVYFFEPVRFIITRVSST